MESEQSMNALFDEFYQWRLEDSPEFATMMGVHDYDDKLESYTMESFRERRSKSQSLLDRAKSLESTPNPDLTQFIEMLELYNECYDQTSSYVFPLSRIDGLHLDLMQTISFMKFESDHDIKKYAKRLSALADQVDGVIEIMKIGIEKKLTLHPVSIERILDDLQPLISVSEACPFSKPLKPLKCDVSDVEEGIHVARTSFAKLAQFIRTVYLPNCRPLIGITSVAGQSYYKQCLKYHIGYEISAQKVHDLGLEEVQRITLDIRKVIEELGLSDSPKEFADRMRKDTKFILGTQEEIKERYEQILQERIQPQLAKFFGTLPQAKLRLQLMDKSRAAGPAALYIQGSSDGERPGTFYINANDTHRNPTYIMPALALHEANPGHHLQTSLLLETANLAKFRLMMEDRRYTDMPTHFPMHTAYTEGWGLYSEYLGHEMGIYRDPYERYGHYSQEMLRACRLVVDTGMHAFGWTRDQAIDFLLSNTASSKSEIESEIDRYITWPGQACGYKIGEIRLKQLRKKAADALGEKFDIREFHDCVLSNVGTMTFLEKAVDGYISSRL